MPRDVVLQAAQLTIRYLERHPDPAVYDGTPEGLRACQRAFHAMAKGLLEHISPQTLHAANEASAPWASPWQVLAAARARHRAYRRRSEGFASRPARRPAFPDLSGMSGVPNAEAYRPVDPERVQRIKALYGPGEMTAVRLPVVPTDDRYRSDMEGAPNADAYRPVDPERVRRWKAYLASIGLAS